MQLQFVILLVVLPVFAQTPGEGKKDGPENVKDLPQDPTKSTTEITKNTETKSGSSGGPTEEASLDRPLSAQPETLASLTPAYFSGLKKDSLLSGLTADQVSKINPQAFSGISSAQLQKIGAGIKGLTPAQVGYVPNEPPKDGTKGFQDAPCFGLREVQELCSPRTKKAIDKRCKGFFLLSGTSWGSMVDISLSSLLLFLAATYLIVT